MKNIIIFLLYSTTLYSQDRLSFVKDVMIKTDVQKSVDYLNESVLIPKEVKDKVVFITFDFDDIYGEEIEGYNVNYSTHIPTLFSELNKDGQFGIDERFGVLFYNYSKNIVFVFFKGSRYFDRDKMKQLSNEVQISKESLAKLEFFKFEKGKNNLGLDAVENFISMDKVNDKFVPVRVNTFDLETFVKVWYGVDVKEISVGQVKYKTTSKKDAQYNFRTHPK